MRNKEFTIDEVMNALKKIPEDEKELLAKSINISNLVNIENNEALFEEWLTTSENQVKWWQVVESGLVNLDRELKNSYEIKEDELFLGISNKLFDRMVTVVSDVSNNEYELIKTRLHDMFERLSKISNFKGDAKMLEVNGIEIKRNVFAMLEAINKNWCNYSDLEKRSIGKVVDYVAFVESVQTFYDLMENWDKVKDIEK